jgi:pimeloyl-[acyl-carrier protein] synthase
METDTTLFFNPFDPEVRANPYPYYRRMLEAPPLKFSALISAVIVSRYDDVASVLTDFETFSNHRPEATPFRQLDLTGGAQTMLSADPPAHARLRRLVARDFTPRRIAALAPRIKEITGALLDEVAAKGEFEAMADLANQLPVLVIAEMLGIPTERHREFKAWSNAIIASSGVPPHMPRPPEAIDATAALRAFLAGEIERRRNSPGPDLISALIASEEADILTPGELLASLILLLMAGNETTTNLIGNGLLALMRHPEQLARLCDVPGLMASAVEEILRFDSPVQGAIRVARKPASIGGVEIEPGTLVIVMLAAANRDPSRFDHPEVFDIARDPNEHLAFGRGIHFCLGAQLARLEGSIAIAAVLDRFPHLELADPSAPLSYRGSLFLRGLAALPLSIG